MLDQISTKTLKNLVIMVGCTYLNSFLTFSRADKVWSFIWSWFECGNFEYPNQVLSINLNFQIFKLWPCKLNVFNLIFCLQSPILYINKTSIVAKGLKEILIFYISTYPTVGFSTSHLVTYLSSPFSSNMKLIFDHWLYSMMLPQD